MPFSFPQSQSLSALTLDGKLLFTTRTIRLFGYGFLSVILVIYLSQIGLTKNQIGVLLTFTLMGDALISLWMTTIADRWGRKKMLLLGSILMVFAGVLFAVTNNFYLLLFAATIGVISPGGNEVGPFLAIEQATLSHIVSDQLRTRVLAWYALVGAFSTAIGAFCSGVLVQGLRHSGMTLVDSCRVVVLGYALIGIVLAFIFIRLSSFVESSLQAGGSKLFSIAQNRLGLPHSFGIVMRLSILFMIDSFAGGFILQSVVAYWFYVRFSVTPAVLGSIFLGVNIFAGLSALIAAKLASRIGLIRTMVFTHIPSNILLILVPFMPSAHWAIFIYLIRSTVAQMDVPARQSYTLAVVRSEERSAALGVANIARTIGASLTPLIVGPMLNNVSVLGMSFILAGGIKIFYDVLLYLRFQSIKPPEER